MLMFAKKMEVEYSDTSYTVGGAISFDPGVGYCKARFWVNEIYSVAGGKGGNSGISVSSAPDSYGRWTGAAGGGGGGGGKIGSLDSSVFQVSSVSNAILTLSPGDNTATYFTIDSVERGSSGIPQSGGNASGSTAGVGAIGASNGTNGQVRTVAGTGTLYGGAGGAGNLTDIYGEGTYGNGGTGGTGSNLTAASQNFPANPGSNGNSGWAKINWKKVKYYGR